MAVNVKMGVDLSSFNSGIREGQGILKGLNAEMKATEAEFKATGNAEKALADKTKTLNSQLQVQKGIADQAAQALKAMEEAGIKPTDQAYQKLYATMMNAQAGMNEAQAALNGLSAGEKQAAQEANNLANGVQSIGKKMSLEQVISGIDRITGAMENAAKKAIQFGEEIWKNIMDSAQLSDDILTQAGMLDMTPEMYQRYKGVFNTIAEVTITDWAAAKRKVEKAMTDPSNDQIDVLRALGFVRDVSTPYGSAEVTDLADNWEQVFWDAATKLKSKVESGELTSEMADVYGEALFGKKYSNLKNLINLGQEAFTAALGKQNVISDEALEKDAALTDAMTKLKASFEALEAEVTSAIAPALTDAANAIDGVLGSILEYLQKPEGQEMLQKLGDAISGLFGDLSKIDPEQVVSGFVEVFTKVTGGIQWLVDNAETAKGILAAVVGAWGAITIGENVMKIISLIDGLKGLNNGSFDKAGKKLQNILNGGEENETNKGTETKTPVVTQSGGDQNTGTGGKNEPKNTKGKILDNAVTGMATAFTLDYTSDQFEMEQERRAYLKKIAEEEYGLSTSDGDVMQAIFHEMAQQPVFSSSEDVYKISDSFTEALKAAQEKLNSGDAVEIPADLENQTTAEDIEKSVGTVEVPAVLDWRPSYMQGYGPQPPGPGGHANGLPFVPYDNYLARLHKGERVLTANQNRHYTYNSNNYFGNVNLNNGQDIEALCNSIDRHNRRQRSGYGS